MADKYKVMQMSSVGMSKVQDGFASESSAIEYALFLFDKNNKDVQVRQDGGWNDGKVLFEKKK